MRYLKFLLCIALFGVFGQVNGQIYINSYRFAGISDSSLLDFYPNADAAYSFRKLDKDYTGDCIIVRRSSGSPSLDTIGFVGNYLDTATLKTFCIGVDCFIRTWYDQSGKNRHMNQATDASQPKIVSSGVLEKDGNFVIANFDGTSDQLRQDSAVWFDVEGNLSIFTAIGSHGTASDQYFLGNRGNASGGIQYFYQASPASYRFAIVGSGEVSYTTTAITKHITSIIRSSTNQIYIYINNNNGTNPGTVLPYTSSAQPMTLGQVGRTTSPAYGQMKGIEFIFYKLNQESNRSGIQTNINTYYSIY